MAAKPLLLAAALLVLHVPSTSGFVPSPALHSLPRGSAMRCLQRLAVSMGASSEGDRSVAAELVTRRSALLGASAAALSLVIPKAVDAAAAPTKIPTWSLEGGVEFPVLALNTAGLSAEDSERAVGLAVKAGITHIDFHPGKERDGVAAYMAKTGRTGLFLNTKIKKAPPGTTPSAAAEATRQQIDEDLKVLGVSSVDMLMLRDSPDCAVIQAQWAVVEQAMREGKCRSVGVINFCEKALRCVLETAQIKPAINYYMLHPGMGQSAHGLREFGESRGIRTFAYGCLGEPRPLDEIMQSDVLKRIGEKHGKAPEEVAVRWVLQTGAAASVRPTTSFGLGKSVCAEGGACEKGLAMRGGSFGWALGEKEMAEIDAMTSPDQNPTLFSSAGCPGAFVMPKK